MDRATTIAIALIIATIAVLLSTPVLDLAFSFMMGGLIPGTEIAIPWNIMMGACLVTAAVVLFIAYKTHHYPWSPTIRAKRAAALRYVDSPAYTRAMNRRKRHAVKLAKKTQKTAMKVVAKHVTPRLKAIKPVATATTAGRPTRSRTARSTRAKA